MPGVQFRGLSILIGVLFFGSILPVQAQGNAFKDPVRFEHLKVEDGLPHATVLGALQDQQGFMWFATADGLSRYDGREFKNFYHERHNENSLSNNNTFALLESSDGLIWVGTDPGGLNIYDPKTGNFSHYRHDENDPDSLAHDSVWSLCEDSDGNIWVGTRGGLSRLDRESGLFTNYLPDAEDPRSLAATVVYRIYEDSAGTIWIGTNGGLQRYDAETDDFTTFVHDPDDSTSLTSTNVWSILEDSRGNFWVGTRRAGLNLFDRETGKVVRRFYHDAEDPKTLSDDNIWNIFEDSQGTLWFLTEFGGLNRYDPVQELFYSYQNNRNDPSTLSNNDVFWMTEDISGVLWVTSRYGGVNKLYDGLSQFGLYSSIPENENTLNASEVYSVHADSNNVVWVGTFGGGLNRFDRKTNKMTFFMNDPEDPTSLSNNKVYYIHRSSNGVLWLGTYGGGLNRLNERTGEFKVYTNTEETPYGLPIKYPTTIEDADSNKLWVGTLGFGLLLFNSRTEEIEMLYEPDADDETSLSEGTIYDLAYDQHGHLWVATARGGLEQFDVDTGVFTHHLNDPDDENSILSNTVHALYYDDTNEMIWAATSGGLSGLNEETGKWTNYTRDNGLPSDTLTGIQPGLSNTLWVSSTKGISRINLLDRSVVSYSVADGLQGDQFQIASSHLGPDGEIFFGGSNGVTYFHPAQLNKNAYLPPIVFTEFLLDDEPVAVGGNVLPQPIEQTDEIILNYDQNEFSIRFVALNYQLSAKNQYQYKLDGYDEDWSPPQISDNPVRYTNLEPGRYTFLVRASNNDGLWNTVEERLEIHILTPWWQTLWFYALLILAFVGVVLLYVRIRFQSIQKVNQELERRVAERTDALQFAQKRLYDVNSELEMQLKEVNSLQVKLKEQAIRDSLTGLYNRRHLNEVIHKELARAHRQGHSVVFLLLDLDHFKQINDTYGHTGGDQALVVLGELLEKHTRSSDYAFRYGGEEFMVMLTGINLDDAKKRAEDLRVGVEKMKVKYEGLSVPLTTSIGVASYPEHGQTAEEMLVAVDDALYKAKFKGRNRVVISGDD